MFRACTNQTLGIPISTMWLNSLTYEGHTGANEHGCAPFKSDVVNSWKNVAKVFNVMLSCALCF